MTTAGAEAVSRLIDENEQLKSEVARLRAALAELGPRGEEMCDGYCWARTACDCHAAHNAKVRAALEAKP